MLQYWNKCGGESPVHKGNFCINSEPALKFDTLPFHFEGVKLLLTVLKDITSIRVLIPVAVNQNRQQRFD